MKRQHTFFLIVIDIIAKTSQFTGEIYWRNPWPSSTRFCHPIKILYEKETTDLCKRKEKNLKEKNCSIKATIMAGCSVSYEMVLTMIDGKVIYHFFI